MTVRFFPSSVQFADLKVKRLERSIHPVGLVVLPIASKALKLRRVGWGGGGGGEGEHCAHHPSSPEPVTNILNQWLISMKLKNLDQS